MTVITVINSPENLTFSKSNLFRDLADNSLSNHLNFKTQEQKNNTDDSGMSRNHKLEYNSLVSAYKAAYPEEQCGNV